MLPSSTTLSLQLAGLICAILSFFLYLNTFNCQFCFDDSSAVKQNQDLRYSSPWTNLLWNDFWGTPMHKDGSHKSYRPLCVATFRLNYLVHGLEPMGYHLVNVVLHAVVCYLYVQLCGAVFTEVWPALIAGLLFAAHPIHTEAVAGVVGRAELLSSLLFLLAFTAYQRAVLCAGETKSIGNIKWLGTCLSLCFLSVLCKEQGITVIAVCLTYDLFVLHKHTLYSAFHVFSKGWPFWVKHFLMRIAILLGFTLGVIFCRLQIMQTTLPVFTVHDNPAVTLPTPYRQLHWLYLVCTNLWLLLSPSFLCADWTMGTIPLITSLTDPRHLLTLLSLSFLLILVLYSLTSSAKRAKDVLFALALMVLPFLPASNLFFPVGFVVAERVLYLPSMGFCMLVGLGVWLALQRKRCTALIIFCLMTSLSIHSLKTLVRNQDWMDNNALFSSAIRINHRNGKLYNNLGYEYEEAGNYSHALKLFRVAALVQPDDIGAHINLGRTLKHLGQLHEAEQAYLTAVELMPTGKSFRVAPSHINVYYNLANLIKLDPSRLQEAYKLYQKAISMKPNFVEAHMNKGDLLLTMNRTEEARQSFEVALQHAPDYTDVHYNLAIALVLLNRRKEAGQSFKRALKLDSAHVHSLLGLASLMQEDGKSEEAMQLFQQVLVVDTSNVRAYFNLALLHLDKREIEKSEEMFLQALSLDPNYRSALYNIAVLYKHKQQISKAIGYLEHLISLHPDHTNGAQLLGDCYTSTKQLDKAEQMYNHVLARNPESIQALHNLGVVKADQGLLDSASTLFRKVLDIDPTHITALKHLQQVKHQKGKQPT